MNITDKEYKSFVGKICRDIAISEWRPDYVVGLVSGGLLPATMISNYFKVQMYALNKDESNLWMAEDAFGYVPSDSVPRAANSIVTNPAARKKILIVNDINDTGKTVNELIEDWTSGCLPHDPAWKEVWNNNVKFAVIYDNVSSKSKVTMDFCGEEITKSKKEKVVFPYEKWWG